MCKLTFCMKTACLPFQWKAEARKLSWFFTSHGNRAVRPIHATHSSERHIPTKVSLAGDRLVVKASASRAEDPGFESRLRQDFSGSSHTSDLQTGTPADTLPGSWCCRISAGTGRPGVSILWLGEMESLICSFYLSVAARKTV